MNLSFIYAKYIPVTTTLFNEMKKKVDSKSRQERRTSLNYTQKLRKFLHYFHFKLSSEFFIIIFFMWELTDWSFHTESTLKKLLAEFVWIFFKLILILVSWVTATRLILYLTREMSVLAYGCFLFLRFFHRKSKFIDLFFFIHDVFLEKLNIFGIELHFYLFGCELGRFDYRL